MSRACLKYLLIDLPSDHEIEEGLATECDVLNAMLANNELSGLTKHIKVGRIETFKKMATYPYVAEIIHISAHATMEGLWLLGEVIKWDDVADCLAGAVAALDMGDERILNLSCCNSEMAAKRFEERLNPFFSGANYFVNNNIPFSTSAIAWTMYFYQLPNAGDHYKHREKINTFLGGETLSYYPYRDAGLELLHRLVKHPLPPYE
jgi:hypothetical protein